jgi:uncharacterized protein YejL (UPF0352 family)
MAITLDGLNLNDGANYFVMTEGVNLGQPQTTWDEVTSYSGTANVQVNIQARKALIPVTIPMMVLGSSVSNLVGTRLAALWTKVDAATYASPLTLVWDSESYSIVYSSRPSEIVRDQYFQLGYRARFTLTLMRLPT